MTTPVRLDPERARWGLGEVAVGIAASQLLAGLVGAAVIGAAGWTGDEAPLWALGLLQLPLWAGWIVALVVAGSRSDDGLVADLGLRSRWVDVPVGLAVGVGAQLLLVPLVYLPVLRLLGRSSEDLSAPARELADRATGPWGWLLLLVMVGVGAPLVEEVFYRGLFLQALRKRGLSDAWACVVSGLVFGAMHLQPLQFLGLALFGVLLAVLTVRSGRLGPAVWAHVGFNSTTVVVLWAGG